MTSPDDHRAAGPYRDVSGAGIWRIGSADSCPTISIRVVSASGVQVRIVIDGRVKERPSPDDHFPAGPYCPVAGSASRRIGGAGSPPTIPAGIVSAAGVPVETTPDNHFAACPHRL